MKKAKSSIIIIGMALVLCLIAAGIFTMTANSVEKKLADQLELGQKYLDELDYEQAIVAYKAAIEIDPKCEEAYLALAEAYVAIGDYESAIDILKQGIEQTESEALAVYLHEVEEMRDDVSGIGHEAEETLREDMENADNQSDGSREEVIYFEDGSYLVEEYDSNGNLIKSTLYDADGSEYVKEYEYDSNGNRIKRTDYNTDGSVARVEEYDSNGNIIKKAVYNADGSINYVEEYDNNGNIIKMAVYNADGSIDYEYEFDGNENIIKERLYNADGSYSVIEYDR